MEPLDTYTANMESSSFTAEEYARLRPYEHEAALGNIANVSIKPIGLDLQGIILILLVDAALLALALLVWITWTLHSHITH
jgi:hypothetical protein